MKKGNGLKILVIALCFAMPVTAANGDALKGSGGAAAFFFGHENEDKPVLLLSCEQTEAAAGDTLTVSYSITGNEEHYAYYMAELEHGSAGSWTRDGLCETRLPQLSGTVRFVIPARTDDEAPIERVRVRVIGYGIDCADALEPVDRGGSYAVWENGVTVLSGTEESGEEAAEDDSENDSENIPEENTGDGSEDHAGETVPAGIVKQPQSAEAAVGDSVVFAVEAEGEGLTYQWQFSPDGGETWAGAFEDGFDTPSLVVQVTDDADGRLYRCAVCGLYGMASLSDAASLTVLR